jgi:hypothetical protein
MRRVSSVDGESVASVPGLWSVDSVLFKLWHKNFFLIHNSFLSTPESIYTGLARNDISASTDVSISYMWFAKSGHFTRHTLHSARIRTASHFRLSSSLVFRKSLLLLLDIFNNVHRVTQVSSRCFWFCEDRCKKDAKFDLMHSVFIFICSINS